MILHFHILTFTTFSHSSINTSANCQISSFRSRFKVDGTAHFHILTFTTFPHSSINTSANCQISSFRSRFKVDGTAHFHILTFTTFPHSSISALSNSSSYSLLKLFTGLATAALMACVLTDSNAINNANAPAAIKIHTPIFTR